ncbi:hypothetical protein [Dactylosporangium matsuzakiense]|uniref:Uncharacterized protein n=1 Tax=Dactylosporangium matsuzakiense TaxID=53360 RepID=A0A9W6NN78_9ACTN|nr:hypothetical protein [Dactylosporangium matsuzakiense]UWZ44857.1 hypothetical protein Dmats_47400 [Dactylosporangium matsuzakiense]GLL03670.1 hypothetical protein GCM10017581_054160 [Dactylosporangium matsuzakiense]
MGTVVVPLLAIGVGGIAWAAWGVHGSGSAQAKGGNTVPLVVNSSTTSPATLLYPGGTADMVVQVHNGNQFPVTIGSVVRTSKPITVDAAHSGCSGALLDMTEDDDTFDVSESIAAGGDKTITLPHAIRMDSSAGNACQGARFTIPVTVTGVSG